MNCYFSYASYISLLNACIANLPLPFSIITSKHIFEVGVQILFGFHIESKENLYTYLKNGFRCNYGERQCEIGYTGIQDRYVGIIGKVTVLHDCHGVNISMGLVTTSREKPGSLLVHTPMGEQLY